jgi:hypothetical protein
VWDGDVPPRREPPAAVESPEVAALKARVAELEAAQTPNREGAVAPAAASRKATGTK